MTELQQVPLTHAWRAPNNVMSSRSGLVVRRLDVSSLRKIAEPSSTLAALVRVLCSGAAAAAAAAELRSLVMWVEADLLQGAIAIPCFDKKAAGFFLSRDQARALAASCPRLGADTRLVIAAEGAVEAVALLDSVPGRSALVLSAPPVIIIDGAADPQLAAGYVRSDQRSHLGRFRALVVAARNGNLDWRHI